jgi:hypothetical protein
MSNPTLTIVAAAELMGVKRSWAHEVLTRRHKQHPELGLLARPTGVARGRFLVDARALREIIRGGCVKEIEDLSNRVGMLESDAITTQSRLDRVERIVR